MTGLVDPPVLVPETNQAPTVRGAWNQRLPGVSPPPAPMSAPAVTSDAVPSPTQAVRRPKRKPPALMFADPQPSSSPPLGPAAAPPVPLEGQTSLHSEPSPAADVPKCVVCCAPETPQHSILDASADPHAKARPVLRIAKDTLFVGKYCVDRTGCTSNPCFLLLMPALGESPPMKSAAHNHQNHQHHLQPLPHPPPMREGMPPLMNAGKGHGPRPAASPAGKSQGSTGSSFNHSTGAHPNASSVPAVLPVHGHHHGSPVQSTPPLRSTNMGLPVSPMVYVTDMFPQTGSTATDVRTPLTPPESSTSDHSAAPGSTTMGSQQQQQMQQFNASFFGSSFAGSPGAPRLNFDEIDLLERLSGGATGEVYRGLHSKTQKSLAIKVMDLSPVIEAYYARRGQDELVGTASAADATPKRLSPANGTDDDMIFAFLKEHGSFGARTSQRGSERVEQLQAAVLRELRVLHSHYRSPHVIKVYDAFFRDTKLYIVMEYMEYGSLENVGKLLDPQGIGRRHPLPERILAVVAEQMLSGLRDMHSMGHIHRDIKPSNILLSSLGAVKLADFGLVEEVASAATTDDDEHCSGTNHFMSPERLKGERHGAACDIWALGLTLADCAVGRYPIDLTGCRDSFEVMARMAQPVHFPPTLAVQLTENFKRFIKLAMHPDPLQRPTAEALLNNSLLSQWRGEFDFAEFLHSAIKSAARHRESARAAAKASKAKQELVDGHYVHDIQNVSDEPDYIMAGSHGTRRGTSGQRGAPAARPATSRSSSASSVTSRGPASPLGEGPSSPAKEEHDAAVAVILGHTSPEAALAELERRREREERRERQLMEQLVGGAKHGAAYESKHDRTADRRTERRKRMQ